MTPTDLRMAAQQYASEIRTFESRRWKYELKHGLVHVYVIAGVIRDFKLTRFTRKEVAFRCTLVKVKLSVSQISSAFQVLAKSKQRPIILQTRGCSAMWRVNREALDRFLLT